MELSLQTDPKLLAPSEIPYRLKESGKKKLVTALQQYYEELPFITMTIVISTYVLINTNTTKMTIPPFVVILGNTYFGIYTFF